MFEKVVFSIESNKSSTIKVTSSRNDAVDGERIKLDLTGNVHIPVKFHLISRSNGGTLTAEWTGGSLAHVAPILGFGLSDDGMSFTVNKVIRFQRGSNNKQDVYIVI